MYGESGSSTLSCVLTEVLLAGCGTEVSVVEGNVVLRVDRRTGAGRSAVYSPGGGIFSWPLPKCGSWIAVDELAGLCGLSAVMACIGCDLSLSVRRVPRRV